MNYHPLSDWRATLTAALDVDGEYSREQLAVEVALLCERGSCAPDYLRQIEQGHRYPGRKLARALEAITGIPAVRLMGWQ